MLPLQEIFNAAWEQAKLKKKAFDPESGRCLYRKRNEDGTCDKCFIGAIIPDEQYYSNYENTGGISVLHSLNLIPSGLQLEEAIIELQQIHDMLGVDEWHNALVAYAENHALVVPA
jgi:hypothetical protein